MKKTIAFSFLAGIVTGAVFAPGWRNAAKSGIKASIKGGRRMRQLSQQAYEDLQDLTAEAVNELAEEESQEKQAKQGRAESVQ